METFERLVGEQLKTMEQLLFLQSEIERCQEIEKQLIEMQQEAKLQSIQEEIQQMKLRLKEIQQTFEKQTEEVIHTKTSIAVRASHLQHVKMALFCFHLRLQSL